MSYSGQPQPIKLQIEYLCMGLWACTDDNNSGEPTDPYGLGKSPLEAVKSYFKQKV